MYFTSSQLWTKDTYHDLHTRRWNQCHLHFIPSIEENKRTKMSTLVKQVLVLTTATAAVINGFNSSSRYVFNPPTSLLKIYCSIRTWWCKQKIRTDQWCQGDTAQCSQANGPYRTEPWDWHFMWDLGYSSQQLQRILYTHTWHSAYRKKLDVLRGHAASIFGIPWGLRKHIWQTTQPHIPGNCILYLYFMSD